MRRGRVRRRGAVGGRAGAGGGAGAAVAGQWREQGVPAEPLVLQLQLEVLADLLREALVLLLQGPIQLGLELPQEVSGQKPDKGSRLLGYHGASDVREHRRERPASGSPSGVPRRCAAAPPSASGPASPASWSGPPPAEDQRQEG